MQSVWIAQNQSYGELYVFFSEEKLVDFLEQEAQDRNQKIFYDLGKYFIGLSKEDEDDAIVFAEEYNEHGVSN